MAAFGGMGALSSFGEPGVETPVRLRDWGWVGVFVLKVPRLSAIRGTLRMRFGLGFTGGHNVDYYFNRFKFFFLSFKVTRQQTQAGYLRHRP